MASGCMDGAGQAQPRRREHHRPQGTALLRKSVACGSLAGLGRREGRSCYSYPRPSPRSLLAEGDRIWAGWLRRCAMLPAAAKARRARSRASSPKISPHHSTSSRSRTDTATAPSGGVLQTPRPPSLLPSSSRFCALPGQPVIQAHSSRARLRGRPHRQRRTGPASTCAGGRRPHCSAFLRSPRCAASTHQEKPLRSGRASQRHRAGQDAGRKGLTHAGVNENKTLQINSI